MTRLEVIKKFLNKESAVNSTGNLSSNGDCLYSYSTCIAEWTKDGDLVVNTTRYSVTTSCHQSLLKRLSNTPYSVDNIPRDRAHIVQKSERVYG